MIVVTGCAGFIGFHLCNKLLKKNKKVIGIDSLNNYYDPKKKIERINILKKSQNFKFYKVNLINFDKIYNIVKLKNIDLIFHLAAQPGVRISIKNPHNTLNQNLISFSNIIEIARIKKVKKFVYASSSSVYGETKKYPFIENDYKNSPVSVYGATKLSNEIIADVYSKNFHLRCVGLRFFTVYGPYGRPDMAYYFFLENLKKNKPINVYNNGIMLRDFTYIDDIISGVISVMNINFKNNHEIINLGKGKPDKLIDLINYLQIYFNKKFKINYINKIPTGDIKKTFANTYKAKKLINWKPKINLRQGLKKFVNWFTKK